MLPAALAGDAERLARFQREAEVLAALNHPNIAAIYGLEKSDGIIALVMELVEGDDLSQRIARGAIPLDEALPIAAPTRWTTCSRSRPRGRATCSTNTSRGSTRSRLRPSGPPRPLRLRSRESPELNWQPDAKT